MPFHTMENVREQKVFCCYCKNGWRLDPKADLTAT